MLIGAACQRYMRPAQVSQNTCLSHNYDYDRVFRTSGR
jgi:hypothetical protein